MSAILLIITVIAIVYAVRCNRRMRYARGQIVEAQMYLAEAIEAIEADDAN